MGKQGDGCGLEGAGMGWLGLVLASVSELLCLQGGPGCLKLCLFSTPGGLALGGGGAFSCALWNKAGGSWFLICLQGVHVAGTSSSRGVGQAASKDSGRLVSVLLFQWYLMSLEREETAACLNPASERLLFFWKGIALVVNLCAVIY